MELAEFKREKIEGREELFHKIIDRFKELDPVAIHQFGSGRYGYQDEFSDFDFWITFPDERIKEIVENKEEIFSRVAPVLVTSDAQNNAPVGGSFTIVLYDTGHGIFQTDYFLAPKSDQNVRDDAIHLHGDDSLPRGEWILDRGADRAWTSEHIYDQILIMSYILNKAIIRGGWNVDMADYLRVLCSDFEKTSGQTLLPLPDSADFEFQKKLFENIEPYGDENQKQALQKLRAYSEQVERLYAK